MTGRNVGIQTIRLAMLLCLCGCSEPELHVRLDVIRLDGTVVHTARLATTSGFAPSITVSRDGWHVAAATLHDAWLLDAQANVLKHWSALPAGEALIRPALGPNGELVFISIRPAEIDLNTGLPRAVSVAFLDLAGHVRRRTSIPASVELLHWIRPQFSSSETRQAPATQPTRE